MIDFIHYSLETLKVQYVLPGKIQSDNLEHRFGKHRQLCGAAYNISVLQVYEAEKKLRIQSVLGLKSARYGNLTISADSLNRVLKDVTNSCANEQKKEIESYKEK